MCSNKIWDVCGVRAFFDRILYFKEAATVHTELESRWKRLYYASFNSKPTPPRGFYQITMKTGEGFRISHQPCLVFRALLLLHLVKIRARQMMSTSFLFFSSQEKSCAINISPRHFTVDPSPDWCIVRWYYHRILLLQPF